LIFHRIRHHAVEGLDRLTKALLASLNPALVAETHFDFSQASELPGRLFDSA
jgi:hypothetical protein